MATCTVDSALHVPLADLGPGALDELRRALRARNPAADRASPFARVPEWIEAVEVHGGEVVIPRGATDVVRRVVRVVRFEDHRVSVPHAFTFAGELRSYQARAVEALLQREQGIAVAPCGAGKTEVVLGAIAAAGQRALVVVPTLDLVGQWRDRARARLGVEAAVFGGGSRDVGPLTIATIQSLATLGAADLADLAGNFGCVAIDECHHTSAESYRAVLAALPARYRWGVTATPTRADGLSPIMHWHLGAIVARVTQADVERSGHALAPRYEQVRTTFTAPYAGPDDWHALLEALVTDEARNAQIVALAVEQGRRAPGIVLTGRVQHAIDLASAIGARGVRAAALVGDLPKRERARVLDAARAGALDVLVATSLADEGLDVPRLAWCALVFPSRAAGRFVQRAGRILRPCDGKPEPVVIDLVDARVGVLAHQARQRERTWRETWGQTRCAA